MLLCRALIAITVSLCGIVGQSCLADEFTIAPNTEKSPTSPLPPQEVVHFAKLPPGFVLSAVAAEPLVQNPIAMTTDERGRLWIAENYSWSGNEEGGFNPEQRDRIIILEDTDGDGIHDQRRVFWDQARMLTSIEVGYGGVWAICLPNLLFIPDANRDGVPDGEPIIMLNGFEAGMHNHTPANGLKWGPDGWLYGRQGILSSSNIGKPDASESQRFRMDTGVWRYHPTRQVAEAVMHGMTNPWGFDFDQYGEMFVINTVIGHLWHVIPGGHTERMFGLDINPYSYRLLPSVADHVHWDTGESWNDVVKGVTDTTSAAGGGHAHIGLMIYQGDNWPPEYQNRVYTLNLHGRRINSDLLQRDGAGYVAKHGPDMCFIEDAWYRGMELLAGPDGGVFIADWSDTGECHDHDGVHRTSGRIYKLTYGTPHRVSPFDLSQRSSDELVALLAHPNTWWARQARRILTERTQQLPEEQIQVLRSTLKQQLQAQDDVVRRLRILETIGAIGAEPEAWWVERLQAANEYERAAALKFLVDRSIAAKGTPSLTFLNALTKLAATDPSGLIQLHLASMLQKLPVAMRWKVALPLAAHEEFAHDRMLPLMIWYGVEPAIPTQTTEALSLLETTKFPDLTELVSRRITVDLEHNPAAFEQLLVRLEHGRCAFPDHVIRGIAQGLDGWQKAPTPANWSRVASKFANSSSEDVRQHVQTLSVLFGDGITLEIVRQNVTNGALPPAARHAALRSLLMSRPADYVPTLIQLLDDRTMVAPTLRGLAQYDDAEIPARILERWGRFTPVERTEAIETLTSRRLFATALLNAMSEGHISPDELSAFHARQIASFNDTELTAKLVALWGDVRVSAAEKREHIEQMKRSLTPEVLATGDASAGRLVFQNSCANCHVLYGVGHRIGPDLTGSHRQNLDYLLENMIDPSASVGADFRSVVVALDDGRVLNGVISEANDRTLILQTAVDRITLDRNQIEEMTATNVSLMPEGLLQNLSPEQIRDLVRYLMSTEQVPLPAQQ